MYHIVVEYPMFKLDMLTLDGKFELLKLSYYSPYLDFLFDVLFFRYGGTITNQIKRLGASCDWTREHFTLDEKLSCKTVF